MNTMKKTTLILAPLCAALTAFGFDSAQEAAAAAAAVAKSNQFEKAANYYEQAARIAEAAARNQAIYLEAQGDMLAKANQHEKAVRAYLASIKVRPGDTVPVSLKIKGYVDNTLVKQRKFDLAQAFLDQLRASPRIAPADALWANRTQGYVILGRDGVEPARKYFLGLLDKAGGDAIVQAVHDVKATYRGREEYAGYDWAYDAIRKRAGKLSEKTLKDFWNKIGYSAWTALYEKGMREADAELVKLGDKKGITFYGSRVHRYFEAIDSLKRFPLPESEIHFPDSIADFGDPMTNGTVHVAKDFGFDEVNATTNLQAALDSGASRVVIENVGKPWYIRTVRIRSNTEVVIEPGVRIHSDRTWNEFATSKAGLFVVDNARNVVLKGRNPNDTDVVISKYHDLMDRARNCRDYGGCGLWIGNSVNVCVKNLRCSDNASDGLALGGLGLPNYNVYFENLDFDSNYSQGCSLISAHNAYFRKVRFRNTAGAEPAGGVDLEPAELNQGNANLYFFDCEFAANMGGGLLFNTSSCYPISLYAKRCVFRPHWNADLMVFLRIGPYLGRNITVPGRAIFDECEFQGYSDISPIRIEGVSLLDLHFKNCTVTDSGKCRARDGAPDASAFLFRFNRDVFYEGVPPDAKEATISFENFKITGYTNAPPIAYIDQAGHYSIRNLKGSIDFNGRKYKASSFNREAPDLKLADVARPAPTNFPAPTSAAGAGQVEQPFTFRYEGGWWSLPPAYTYLFFGEKGKSAEFLFRYTGWIPGDKTIRLQRPDGGEMKLGEVKAGDNRVQVKFPATGWYLFQPPARHVLVNYRGVALNYYAGMGGERKIQIDAPQGYTGYFEVPAGKEAVVKVFGGEVQLRDATGALVETLKPDGARTGGAVNCAVKSASGKAEVWSFHVPRRAHFKFFAPFNGVWGDSPSALPTAAADAVRSPVVTVERVEEEKTADTGPAVSLGDYLAKYPAIRKIVDDEIKARLEWARKGDNAASLKKQEERLAKMRANVANERQQKEIADEEKNIPPLKEFADMEARILKMDKARLERYAFCNAFAVLYGLYYDKTIGNDFIRCLHEGADMPAKYPDVYWWIYKKAYESYVHGHVAEFGLKFRDFTLISDDDAKLDKLILVLEGFLTPIIPADLAQSASSAGMTGDNR